jgi:hypothetical protein
MRSRPPAGAALTETLLSGMTPAPPDAPVNHEADPHHLHDQEGQRPPLRGDRLDKTSGFTDAVPCRIWDGCRQGGTTRYRSVPAARPKTVRGHGVVTDSAQLVATRRHASREVEAKDLIRRHAMERTTPDVTVGVSLRIRCSGPRRLGLDLLAEGLASLGDGTLPTATVTATALGGQTRARRWWTATPGLTCGDRRG